METTLDLGTRDRHTLLVIMLGDTSRLQCLITDRVLRQARLVLPATSTHTLCIIYEYLYIYIYHPLTCVSFWEKIIFFSLSRPMLASPRRGDCAMAPRLDYTFRNTKAQGNDASKVILLNHHHQSQNKANSPRPQMLLSHTQY